MPVCSKEDEGVFTTEGVLCKRVTYNGSNPQLFAGYTHFRDDFCTLASFSTRADVSVRVRVKFYVCGFFLPVQIVYHGYGY